MQYRKAGTRLTGEPSPCPLPEGDGIRGRWRICQIVFAILTSISGSSFAADENPFGHIPVESGYVPTPWAKSLEPATLAALHKLRPTTLPAHPMARWVADRIARDTA